MRNLETENELRNLADHSYIIDDMMNIPYLLGMNTSPLQKYIIEKLKKEPKDINLLINLDLYQNQETDDDGESFPIVKITFREIIYDTEGNRIPFYHSLKTIYYNELTGEITEYNPTFILDIFNIDKLATKYNMTYDEIILKLFHTYYNEARDNEYNETEQLNIKEIYELTDNQIKNDDTRGEKIYEDNETFETENTENKKF